MNERGRFAPSPTGELHLGNARSALLSWLWARKGGGGYAIRIEDIDTPRVRPGMAEQQLAELAWLGLDWDGPPVFQSQRTGLYEDALQKLGDHVYECFCSRAEIAAASAPHGDEGPRKGGGGFKGAKSPSPSRAGATGVGPRDRLSRPSPASRGSPRGMPARRASFSAVFLYRNCRCAARRGLTHCPTDFKQRPRRTRLIRLPIRSSVCYFPRPALEGRGAKCPSRRTRSAPSA